MVRRKPVPLLKFRNRDVRSIIETLTESRLWKFASTWGLLSAVLGGLILACPGTSILVASTLFAVYLLLSGFTGVAMAFTLPESAGMRVMLFISGVLSVTLAVLCFRNFGNRYPILLLAIGSPECHVPRTCCRQSRESPAAPWCLAGC